MCLAQGANPFEIRTTTESRITSVDSVTSQSLIVIGDSVASVNPFDVRQGASVNTYSVPSNPTRRINNGSGQKGKRNLVIGIISFLSLILMAFTISLNQDRVQKLFQSLYNTSSLKTLHRGTKGLFESQYILFYLIFIINMSLFALLVIPILASSIVDVKWWYAPCVIFGVYLMRHFIMALLSFIFPMDSVADLHNYNIGVHNMMLGMIILPIVIGIQFGPDAFQSIMIYVGLFVVVVFYLFRQIKGLLFALGMRDFNLMYFFIYLCALEISPILVSLKVTGIVE